MRRLDATLLVCPTYNPGNGFSEWLAAYQAQGVKPCMSVIIDSASDDGFVSQVTDFGFKLERIAKSDFNHGGTRQQAVNVFKGFEYVIYLTQDAVLADACSLERILEPFVDDAVAAVCGRQLPRKEAAPLEAHARIYNYSSESFSRSIKDAEKFGLKTAFISNSFAAYRISALNRVGGFPDSVIFGEDMFIAGKLLLAGYKVAYAADARVYHSHAYTLMQEFRRYFDMGVFHSRESWLRRRLGGADGEGVKFVASELGYLFKFAVWQIPEALLRTMFRYAGFRLGLLEKRLPLFLKKRLAMNKGYFRS